MTGPEHFDCATRCIAEVTPPGIPPFLNSTEMLALAQVHATLALVWAANRAQTETYGLLRSLIDAREEK